MLFNGCNPPVKPWTHHLEAGFTNLRNKRFRAVSEQGTGFSILAAWKIERDTKTARKMGQVKELLFQFSHGQNLSFILRPVPRCFRFHGVSGSTVFPVSRCFRFHGVSVFTVFPYHVTVKLQSAFLFASLFSSAIAVNRSFFLIDCSCFDAKDKSGYKQPSIYRIIYKGWTLRSADGLLTQYKLCRTCKRVL